MADIKRVGTFEKGAEMFKLKIEANTTAEIYNILLTQVLSELRFCYRTGLVLRNKTLKDADGNIVGKVTFDGLS